MDEKKEIEKLKKGELLELVRILEQQISDLKIEIKMLRDELAKTGW